MPASLDLFYGIEFQTPDLFQKVNILNNENPLIRRYGNPDLRGATNHRMQFGLNRNWREKRISDASAAACASSATRCRRA